MKRMVEEDQKARAPPIYLHRGGALGIQREKERAI